MSAARKAYKSWNALSGHARAKHIYNLARHVQKHSRLIAVLEALDNGKSIRETRDADIPVVIRHLYHYAGNVGIRMIKYATFRFVMNLHLFFIPVR